MAVVTEESGFNFPFGIRRLMALPTSSGSGQVIPAGLRAREGTSPSSHQLRACATRPAREGRQASLGHSSCPCPLCPHTPLHDKAILFWGQNQVSTCPRPTADTLSQWTFGPELVFPARAGRVGPCKQTEGQAGFLVISVLIFEVPQSSKASQRRLGLEGSLATEAELGEISGADRPGEGSMARGLGKCLAMLGLSFLICKWGCCGAVARNK